VHKWCKTRIWLHYHATPPQVLFANIAAAPDATVDDLGIMAPDERRLVMRHTYSPLQLGPAVGAYARQTIHGMLEHWAAATPGAPAAAAMVRAARFEQLCMPNSFASAVTRCMACAQGVALSYAELDKRANQLAHRLIGLGVGPEVPVGVMMERSLELVVALLGVLKAGGAYVPMDPSYPAARLALMMEDSEVCAVLSGCSCGRVRCLKPALWSERCALA
jgi:non-ribosomal peptide synthetase component F